MSPLEIHDAALAIHSPEARRRYLNEACDGDEVLLRRVEAMLGIDESVAEELQPQERFLRGLSATKLLASLRGPKHA